MKKSFKRILGIFLSGIATVGIFAGCGNGKEGGKKEYDILNVSYDPTRELYDEYNKAFSRYYEDKTGEVVNVRGSYGGSGSQARAVIDGLEADVVTLALGADIDSLNSKSKLIDENWQSKFKDNSTPYTSTIVLLVRKGNPKNIKGWDDLIKDGVNVITANPKTSGGARWSYLAAFGNAYFENNKDLDKAKDYIKKLYKNVGVLDSGTRQSTNTFVQNEIGDVLIAWENEALLALKKGGSDKFEIVYPNQSVLAEPPVAVVDEVAKKHGTEEVSKEYLNYLYSNEGQEIIAKNFYRPRNNEVLEKYKDKFKEVKFFTIDDLGGWKKVQKEHFDDGGIFDEIYKK